MKFLYTLFTLLLTNLYADEELFAHSILWEAVVIFALITGFFVYRHYELKKINKQLQKYYDDEVKNTKDKNEIIFNQKKFAAMDEVLKNIAHQWRQPLSQVNSAVLVIDDRMYEKGFKDDVVEEKLLEIESLTKYMSKTIDDFKSFFNENKKQESFSIKDLIDKSIYIIKGTLLNHNIEVENRVDKKFIYYGYPNELEQVILVILNNAKDVLVSRNVKSPKITLDVLKIKDSYHINIKDNGGGIDETIMDKIFDPYFTTKYKSQGTGLGLYFSKIIVQDRMNAELSVKNLKNGACFTIVLKADNEE